MSTITVAGIIGKTKNNWRIIQMRRELTLEESKSLQLEMLKEVDRFCKMHDIRYSLAFGTLLGAVRHKGFIPWDDDVDIMMPLPDLLKLKRLFKSDTMEYCDVDNHPYYSFSFSRLVSKKTYNKTGLFLKSDGVCIDVYPIVSIPDDCSARQFYWEKGQQIVDRRKWYLKWGRRFFKLSPIRFFPNYEKVMRGFRDHMLYHIPYGSSKTYYAIAGYLYLRDKMTYDFDIFGEMTQLEFEGSYYPGIAQYDKFLTLRYGDYMQLPPENQRHPYHGGHFYWK